MSDASSQLIFPLMALIMISCTFMTRCCSSGLVSIAFDTYPFSLKRSFHLFSHRSLHLFTTAKDNGIDPHDFSDYVESIKDSENIPNDSNFT